jgi:hypothetical protein
MNSYHDWLMKGGFKAKNHNGHEVEMLKTDKLASPTISLFSKRYAIFMGGQRRWLRP